MQSARRLSFTLLKLFTLHKLLYLIAIYDFRIESMKKLKKAAYLRYTIRITKKFVALYGSPNKYEITFIIMKQLNSRLFYNNDNVDITVSVIISLSKFFSFQFYTYYLLYFVFVNITFETDYLRERNFIFIIIKISERFGTLKEELNVTVLFILEALLLLK